MRIKSWLLAFLIASLITAGIVFGLNSEFPSVPMNAREIAAVGFSVGLTLAACRATWRWTRGR